MSEKRFQYGYSRLYGWCVYDRDRGFEPAYDACCELLPRVSEDVAESPVQLVSEYRAMQLCRKLNRAARLAEVGCGGQ